jgi:hypothetical protein
MQNDSLLNTRKRSLSYSFPLIQKCHFLAKFLTICLASSVCFSVTYARGRLLILQDTRKKTIGYKKAGRLHENLEHLGTKVAFLLILRKIYTHI